MPDIEERPPEEDPIEGRKDLMKALGLCLLAVVIVRSFIFEPFKIPSSSMLPTLRIGDHIFVSKFNYGLSIPFTKVEFLRLGTPKRGEVIVFLTPRDESLHYIKRVIGIPGDRIAFKGKDIYINGEIVKHEPVNDQATLIRLGADAFAGIYREELGTEHFVRYVNGERSAYSKSEQEETIPPDKFFVVGDNRDDSYDSRSWGFVPRENIKGRAVLIWMSLDPDAQWDKWQKVRWDRCGTLIR